MEPFTSSGNEPSKNAELWEGKVTAAIKGLIGVGESLQSTKSQSYILITASKNEPHPTGLARMADRRLVSFSETNEHVKLDCKVVKQITGGTALTARLMRQDFSEFQPKFTAILDTNDIPTIDDQTAAMHRRLVVIPWPFTPTKPNEKLKEELLKEAEGILRWVVEGAMLYLREGLTAPAGIVAATAKLWESIDTVQMWMTNRAIVDPDPTIKTEAS